MKFLTDLITTLINDNAADITRPLTNSAKKNAIIDEKPNSILFTASQYANAQIPK